MRDSVTLYPSEAMRRGRRRGVLKKRRGGPIAAARPGVSLRSMAARAADEIRDIIVQQF
jgi:hypothetical protein